MDTDLPHLLFNIFLQSKANVVLTNVAAPINTKVHFVEITQASVFLVSNTVYAAGVVDAPVFAVVI